MRKSYSSVSGQRAFQPRLDQRDKVPVSSTSLPEASPGQTAHFSRDMTDRPSSSDADADDRNDGQDLLELLQALGFGHWHSALLNLFERYDGWLSDYWMDPAFDLDFWPVGDVIKVLVDFPLSQAGNDLALALELSECDFLVRLARDEVTGQAWDPLAQRYADFMCTHTAEPFWGTQAPWQADEFARWVLSQLPPRSTPDVEGPPQA